MLRILVVSLVSLIALFSTFQNEAAASTAIGKNLYLMKGVTIELNGEKITFDDPILSKSNYLLLPMRDFYEAIGATVTWNKKSQTASSIKNGHIVDLTINSKKAKVDGKSTFVQVAPMLYKNSTYVPLRFVSENFDGTVTWNQKQQKVTIALTDDPDLPNTPTVPDSKPTNKSILHMNDSRIIMDEPIITRNGRTYVPAKYFVTYLENAYGNKLSNTEYELTVAETNFVFTNDSNRIYVDGQSMEVSEIPFSQYGETYVPVHFIINSLTNGGRIQYNRANEELYIYINEYIFSGKKLDLSYGSLKVPELVPTATLEGTRDLLVSDNPETLTSSHITTDTTTLAQYNVQTTSSKKEHSIFGWHLNYLNTKAKIGITIQNVSESNTLEIAKAEGASKISLNNSIKYEIGLPLADAYLNGNLRTSQGDGIQIAPGETKVIESYLLDEGKALGFLTDLDVHSLNGANGEYIIRVVLSKKDEDNLEEIHSEPISLLNQHPRGAWPSSTIATSLPTYTVDSAQVGYNLSNGKTDYLLTAENSLTNINGAGGNPGHFGMTYKVNVPVSNPSTEEKVIKIKLAGRGGQYSGAIRYNGEVYLIPTIKPGVSYVELPEYVISGGSDDTIQLELMHAGGGNLPVAVYVETK
ncbi:copper amine oxidase N-terminal domain-containing protein [Ureibacillus aquaedulcis]|uniref:Copper amine oxidase N-terminal domain-containing protein n=1 Tax=Ureibacillus aquaedulcis TaxID=3058421 RepID=A0ABT8GL79_9BACL|nr:copper amine oxidase N-terminal domain-containing protein [Ureibacillus sp. BA0131]MDN4492172.1 copper amine oxidase N-terminal domain-containing protein [Ureibacillus sp. BA0131]